jgi:hypothetical protein
LKDKSARYERRPKCAPRSISSLSIEPSYSTSHWNC